jgi:hypothetical protein
MGAALGQPDIHSWQALPSVLSLLLAILWLRVAKWLSCVLVRDSPTSTDDVALDPSALQLVLQLVGVYVALSALPALPSALAAGMTTGEHERFGTPAPVDHVWQFIHQWERAIECLLQAALGAFVCLRARGLAGWLRSHDRAAPPAPGTEQGQI